MMEKFEDNKEAIKALLKQGKLVVSGRGTGKTAALVELLHENPRTIVIVPNSAGLVRLLDMYFDKYGESSHLSNRRVFVGTQQTDNMAVLIDPRRFDIYVDEFNVNAYTGAFYAAVTSFDIPVVVL
jgi:hypothetical protein